MLMLANDQKQSVRLQNRACGVNGVSIEFIGYTIYKSIGKSLEHKRIKCGIAARV